MKNVIRRNTILASMLFGAALALPSAALAFSLEITDWGIYAMEIVGREPPPITASGETLTYTNVKLLQQTVQIPACLGTSFGFRVSVSGAPESGSIGKLEISHPPYTDKNNQTWHREQWDITFNDTTSRYEGWGFVEEYELVPGDWNFSLTINGETVSKAFKVVTAQSCDPHTS